MRSYKLIITNICARLISFLLVFAALTAFAESEAHAACTDPDRPLGALHFNSDHDAFQGCTAAGWAAFHGTSGIPVADGLVGYWRLDEGSDTIATDAINDWTLNLQGTATEFVPNGGRIAGGIASASSNPNRAEMSFAPDILSFENRASFTIAVWVYVRSMTGDDYPFVVSKFNNISGDRQGWAIRYARTGVNPGFGFRCIRSNGGFDHPVQPADVEVDRWYHVICTYDGDSIRLYIDGAHCCSANSTRNLNIIPQYLSVSQGSSNANVASSGRGDNITDDVRIYNRALSAAEVQELYESSFCTGPDGRIGKVAYNEDYNVFQGCTHRGWKAFHRAAAGAGTSCSDPERPVGRIAYNEDFDVFQGCTAGGWKALHPFSDDPCDHSPDPGTQCKNGTIYAGQSPDGDVPMYTTPLDAGRFYWNNGNTSGYVTTNVNNWTTGEANTLALYGTDSDSDMPEFQPHEAASYCFNLVAHGHEDWYLPAMYELGEMCSNSSVIGGFVTTNSYGQSTYHSSSENGSQSASHRNFDGCGAGGGGASKSQRHSVRCVRKD